jgi:hypothetical protein
MSEKRSSVQFNGFGVTAVLVAFLLLWSQSGWYRIDCALGIKKACDLIERECIEKQRP